MEPHIYVIVKDCNIHFDPYQVMYWKQEIARATPRNEEVYFMPTLGILIKKTAAHHSLAQGLQFLLFK